MLFHVMFFPAMDTSEEDMSAVNATQFRFEAELDNVNAELTGVDTDLTTIKAKGGCAASCQAINQSVLVAGIDKNNVSIRGFQ